MDSAEEILEQRLLDKLNSSKVVNKIFIRARAGELLIDNPPLTIMWYEGREFPEPSQERGVRFDRQILFVPATPRFGFLSYGATEKAAKDAYEEAFNIVLGLWPNGIADRTVIKPFYPVLGDLPLKDKKYWLAGGFFQLEWEIKKTMEIF